jgi:hypothetical protein
MGAPAVVGERCLVPLPGHLIPAAPGTERQVLAWGLWLKTERRGDLVLRRRQWWCPRPLGDFLLVRLVIQARRFERYLPVLPLRVAQDRNDLLVLQPYAKGATPLRRLDPAQLKDPKTVRSLCRFWAAVHHGWQRGRWLPDIGGRAHLPWELYRPLHTDNVIVDDAGDCWLVDAGASAVFHSARSPFGRLHAALMLRAVRHCMRQLGCGVDGPCR